MPFKYKTELSTAVKPCPAIAASELKTPLKAYRLVSQLSCTDADFVPPGIMNRGANRGRPAPCDSYALSFFESKNQAAAFYCKLKAQLEKQKKTIRLGPYVAECVIDVADGLCMPTRQSDGHFDLHEFKSAAIEQASTTIGKVNCGQS